VKRYAEDLWSRASEAVLAAQSLLEVSPDGSASRAYYAAFYAVSALFALEGKTFKRHATVDGVMHIDLVKSGRWPAERGKDYTRLVKLRDRGDYGAERHVSREEAEEAIVRAQPIIEAVRQECPELDAPGKATP